MIVAGGQESMSQAPHAMKIRNGVKMGNGTMIDTMICDGLTDAFSQIHMGITGILKHQKMYDDVQSRIQVTGRPRPARDCHAFSICITRFFDCRVNKQRNHTDENRRILE